MNIATSLVSSCLQLLWPAHCAACDVLVHSDDTIFCGACAQSINPLGLACAACGLPLLGDHETSPRPRCSGCVSRDFAFSRACAAFEYGAAMASAIVRMKHGGRPDLARRLGRLLQDAVLRALAAGPAIDVLVPVPLHPRKLRKRGFNQALELARVVLGRLRDRASAGQLASVVGGGLPGSTGGGLPGGTGDDLSPGSTLSLVSTAPRLPTLPTLERHLLRRVRHTRELGRSGPGARRIEVFGAFGVADPRRVEGRRFLVLDDVMTTGATLNECAETLFRAGAAEVRVVALARAV
jgi:predicted amidophosphoribosyltransferase